MTRRFGVALDLGTPTGHASAALQASGKAERILRAGPAPGLPGCDLVADEETLPFAPESLDCVVSLLALQGVNDLPGALALIRRALRPDGLFTGACSAARRSRSSGRLPGGRK